MLNKLLIHIYAKEFQLIRLFRTFDESYIVQLIIRSKPVRFAAGSIIYDTGDISDDICFIIRGSVQFFLHDGVNNVVCGYAREGGYFGDFEYIKHSTRLCTYKCEHECNILSISQQVSELVVKGNMNIITEYYETIYNLSCELSKNINTTKENHEKINKMFHGMINDGNKILTSMNILIDTAKQCIKDIHRESITSVHSLMYLNEIIDLYFPYL